MMGMQTGAAITNGRDAGGASRPFLEAALVAGFILALFYNWFALADRYAIFLYGHTTTNMPTTRPFDGITASRYWMAGLVAAGFVLVIRTGIYWLLGRLAGRGGRRFIPAPWMRVWLPAAVGLAIGIPLITMTVNQPKLPASLAAASAAATVAGLALALLPGKWAAQRPGDLAWLVGDGAALVPALLLIRAVELPEQGLSISPATARMFAIGAVVGGAFWLAVMTGLRHVRRRPTPGAAAIFLAGLGLSYVLLPLAHYLLASSAPYRYISNAANFFASNWWVQIAALLAAAGLAWAAAAARRRLDKRLL